MVSAPLASQGELYWEEFASLLCVRFVDKLVTGIVDEFNELQQIGNVEEYQEKFEELKTYMLIETPTLLNPILFPVSLMG